MLCPLLWSQETLLVPRYQVEIFSCLIPEDSIVYPSPPQASLFNLEYMESCCVHTCMCVRAYTHTHPHTPTFFCDLNSSGLQNTQGGVGSDQNILKHNSTELVKRSSCVEADRPIVEVKPSLSLGDINANNSGKPTI